MKLGAVKLAALAFAMLIAGVAGVSLPGRAKAADLRLFYCYVPNQASSTIYVSDVHAVGPVAERASYGEEFARYLQRRGRVEAGTTGHCVMRSTNREIDGSRTNLSRMDSACLGCQGLTQTEDVIWPRATRSIASVLAGTQVVTKPDPKDPDARSAKSAKPGEGAWLMARTDDTDVVYVVNQANGGTLVRLKADQRPGKWRYLLQNERCEGWIGIAFATNGSSRTYLTVVGQEDAAIAKRTALGAAENLAEREGPGWRTGILDAFENRFEHLPIGLANAIQAGPIATGTELVARQIVSGCRSVKVERYATVGVRG